MTPWLSIAPDSDFSIHNLPFGIFSTEEKSPRAGIAIGDQIVDLAAWVQSAHFQNLTTDWGTIFSTSAGVALLQASTLNGFIALGKSVTVPFREAVQAWLCNSDQEDHSLLVDRAKATMHLPVQVGDYTDFYSSIEHATNVGMMFRDPENALLPNWKHIPVGYHGRASSIIPSGVPIRRPKGQVLPKGETQPVFQPSGRLDFELEMAFIIGKANELGEPISTAVATDHIFGMVLFNDWSARDIQKWEYVPLGPFLGKNFASSASPWIVTLEALAPFKVTGPTQEPKVLSYLEYEGQHNYDIALEVGIQPQGATETIVSRSNYKYMYWNMAQQLAHHSVNGCNMQVGDVLASGTISGKDETSYGSMLEIAWAGTKPIQMSDGSERRFIHDHDTVSMRGWAEKDGVRVGFGEVRTEVLG
ncbi:MAG: fumarylacetoacetase [Bacteroidota bacterium]